MFYQIGGDDDNVGQLPIQSISELFTLIETNKQALCIETYSLSQTTLEQVFLSFAREQKSEDEQLKRGKIRSSDRSINQSNLNNQIA